MGYRAGGHVYVLRAGDWRKIGKTSDLEVRVKRLAVQLPFPVELEHTIECRDPGSVEAVLHRLLSGYRMNGEWFELPEEVVESIKDVRRVRFGGSADDGIPEVPAVLSGVAEAVQPGGSSPRAREEAAMLRVVLEERHQRGLPDLSCPKFHCAYCQEPAGDGRGAMYVWDMSDPKAQAYIVHKGACDRRFEARCGFDGLYGTMDLQFLLVFLLRNHKVDYRKAARRADAFVGA